LLISLNLLKKGKSGAGPVCAKEGLEPGGRDASEAVG
jgi:hypothetical protein